MNRLEAQRTALKMLVPQVHGYARDVALTASELPSVASHVAEVARELRVVADRLHEISEASPSVIAAFFGEAVGR